jgi:hypothetical protein
MDAMGIIERAAPIESAVGVSRVNGAEDDILCAFFPVSPGVEVVLDRRVGQNRRLSRIPSFKKETDARYLGCLWC